MRIRAWSRLALPVVAALTATTLLAGCVFFPPPEDPFGTGDMTTFATGHATMTVDGERVELNQIAPGPHLISGIGREIYRFNDDGWGLRLTGGMSGFMPTMLSIDRIRNAYWSAQDFGACSVKLDSSDKDGVKGSATCKELHWSDMLKGGASSMDNRVKGEDPFDATIEFEALPGTPGA
jgi:hypothetical protein